MKVTIQHPALEDHFENGHDGTDIIIVDGQMIVCPECNGFGHHVRRDIDDSALVDSMREDGDDEGLEAYHRGSFDVSCDTCHCNNVIPKGNLPEWAQKLISDYEQGAYEDRRYAESERRMGA